ncbi:putative phosphodiesterase [Desulfobaculum xiamenense]|uniref:Putative phosphodiesterase n=1 Tax=Desulfobaculum xiamenense TaxID=995050 RepID=A0A846QVY6_9BACT|nr:metallophosphoesterase family protein [Desulfobaculum xiamenense]NJB69284.1 putative phosphodiesterase [Desulfobaculum xiamenense]
MKLAVLSDIHGNLNAFEAVLADMDAVGVDEIASLGDIIGYGPNPDDCVALLRSRTSLSVLGNHEHGVLRERHRVWFGEKPRIAVEITAALISADTRAYIASLPRAIVFRGMRFVHGYPPDSPYFYLYAADEERLARTFARLAEDICFVGHTHMLELVADDHGTPVRTTLTPGVHTLPRDRKHIVNVGSVGQPRDDFDRRAKYVIFDTQTRTLEVRLVAYDARPMAERMLAQGVPEVFARRLFE